MSSSAANPTPNPTSRVGVCVLASVVLAGCGDLATGPLVEVVTDEPVPTLQFDATLPTLPEVIDRWGGSLSPEPVSERWTRSWSRTGGEGVRERERIYRALTPELARSFSAGDLEPLEGRLAEALAGITDDLASGLPSRLALPVSRARASARTAREARVRGDVEGALSHLLRAFDQLYSVTAEATAIALLREAEDALRRKSSDDSYPQRSRDRVERLLLGARSALDDGEDALALRRAFYGYQLVTESGAR